MMRAFPMPSICALGQSVSSEESCHNQTGPLPAEQLRKVPTNRLTLTWLLWERSAVWTNGGFRTRPLGGRLSQQRTWLRPSGSGRYWGFAFGAEPNAFFSVAENFDQLHDRERSSHRVALDRSTASLVMAAGKFVGVITIGDPTLLMGPVGCCAFSRSA